MLNKTLILLNSFPGDWFIEFRTRQHYNHVISGYGGSGFWKPSDYNVDECETQ